MFKKVNPKQNFPEMEREVLKFWKENKIFEKSVEQDGKRPTYSFFDGPPFATGLPHYGHIVASLIKDVVPRYWTMRGYKVERRWGWDCHGLPIENLIEKEHHIKNKQDIEKWGIDKFNEACHSSVLRYADEWKKFIPRIGRWVDIENDYRTMDWKYTESIWWVFSELYKKGLIYEGYKSMHICPRCETTLSNFEVTQGYKEITDLSITAKFKLNPGQKISDFEVGENAYILSWTTTPWTLPGNVALAVGKDISYLMIADKEKWERYVLSEDNYNNIPEQERLNYRVDRKFKGKDLMGLKYIPLFDYYSRKKDLKNRENGWKIYAGDFVSTGEGTGVVHIAPAFGEDDMKMGEKHKLPFVQHVKMNGRFADEVMDFREKIDLQKNSTAFESYRASGANELGEEAKPKRNPRETDEKIADYLWLKNGLFKKEKYKHSYPHCWRCDTPLLNYAANSWFVKVAAIKKKMAKNNQQIKWMPEYIKEGRFGKWLEDARDWAVSRSRFWGAPIPVWRCEEEVQSSKHALERHRGFKIQNSRSCGNLIIVDSRKRLAELAVGENTLIVVRHGETDWNREKRMLGRIDMEINETGKRQAKKLIGLLEKEKIDIVISSPLRRALQTAEIVTENKVKILKDELLEERSMGDFEGMTSEEILEKYPDAPRYLIGKNYYWKDIPGGESFESIKERVDEFIEKVNKKYQGKRILVFSHAGFMDMLYVKFNNNDYLKGLGKHGKNCSVEKYNLIEVVDLHKPAIDGVVLKCPRCGGEARRVQDVFDCWFESGSMPYAQWHYPFENQNKFEKSFPADFIAEGLDQTRGWFYTLIVLSTALFDKPAFRNVIVNGIVLAQDGQKMSKRLKNYPEPGLLIEKYGADALRYYLLTSPVMKAENLNFSEKGVEEVLKRFILTLWNAYSFLVMNAGTTTPNLSSFEEGNKSDNLLDKWIISELNILIEEVNKQMQNYDLVKVARPLREFIDKLSNWYVRRSRKRFSSENIKDRNFAFQTLCYVLVEYSKLIAPFMPFLAEEMFRNLTGKESVHLEEYPKTNKKLIDKKASDEMNFVREAVSLGLAARVKNGLKVRQPLSKLQIANCKLQITKELLDLIKDELNIKEIEFTKGMKEKEGWAYEEDGKIKIGLNLEITDELRIEGVAREIVRHIQTMRKEAKYDRDDRINIKYGLKENGEEIKKVFDERGDYIRKECLAERIDFADKLISGDFDSVKELKLGNWKLEIGIRKIV